MQVRDVRVYDYARSDGQISSDRYGAAANTNDTNLRLAYTFDGSLQSSIPNQAPAKLVNFKPQSLVSNSDFSKDINVSRLQVAVSGVLDGSSERLVAAGTSIAADGSGSSGTVTLAGATWNWAYVAGAVSGAGTFTFTAPNQTIGAGAAQSLLESMAYRNVATTPIAGSRVFGFTSTGPNGYTYTPAPDTVLTPMRFSTGDTPQPLATDAVLTEINQVRSVQVTVSGVLDGASEKLTAAGSSIAADGSVASGTVTVAANGATPASTWTWAYVAGAVAGTGTFTFTAPSNGASSSAAQDLLQSLAYSDESSTPTAGNRGFSITATDVSGNTSTAVTATLNTLQKSQLDLDGNSNGNDFSSPAINVSVTTTEQGSAIAPNTVALTSDSSVSRIEIRLGGAGLDLLNDKLVFTGPAAGANPLTLWLNTTSWSHSDISIGGIGGLRYSYSRPGNLLIITSSTGGIAPADVDDIVRALQFQNPQRSPGTAARTFQISVVNAAGQGASSTSTLTLLDDLAPVAPALALGSGVSGGANLAEATASSGVVLVNAESGSTVRVTFADSSNPINRFVKIITGTGSLRAVTLAAGDLGNGAGTTLHDGTINVTAVVTDAAGNQSAAGQTSFNLDAQPPAQPALAIKSGQDATIDNSETGIDIEVAYTGMEAGDVITLFNGANALGSAYTVVAADVTAAKANIRVGANLLGTHGSKSITAKATDQAGNIPSIASAPLLLAVDTQTPGIVIKAGQDDYLNATETGIDLEVRSTLLGVGDTIQLKLGGSNLGTAYTVVADDVTAGKASIHVLKTALGNSDGSKSITADFSHGGGTTTSPTLSLTLDTVAPSGLALNVKLGEDNFIKANETGVNLELHGTGIAVGDRVTLKNGNSILVNARPVTQANLTDGFIPFSVAAADLGADGIKSLSAVVSDAAGNSGTSAAINLTLDTTVAPALRSNALTAGVDTAYNNLVLAVDDAVGSDPSTSNGVSTTPYIHITGLDAGSSWQYSLDSGATWTTVAAHNAKATDATLSLPASSTAYASGNVKVRQVDNSGLATPETSNSAAITITPTITVSGAVDDVGNANNASVNLQAVPARYLRITTNGAGQSLNWSDLRVWVMHNGIETELTARSGWVFSGSANGSASNLTDAAPDSTYSTNPVNSGTWLQADLGGYYSVSRVQLRNLFSSASNQTVSLSTNDMAASGIGVGTLLGDATVQNFNTDTVASNSTLTLRPSLATDDSTPTLQGKLASTPLPNGTEYAVYITNLDNATPTPTKLGVPTTSDSDWSFTPGTALADGRYAFTLVTQATGNSTFSSATAKSASSIILNIDNNGAAANPTLYLNGSAAGTNTSFISYIGSANPLTLAGSPNPYVDLPDVLLGSDLTLEAWVNFSTLFDGERVFEIGNNKDDTLILGVQADGRVSSTIRRGLFPNHVNLGEVEYVDQLTSTLDATRPALVTGNWYHLALVVSGNTQTVYVNGVPWVSGTLSTFVYPLELVRSNTWVGGSIFGVSNSTMQVRDVRVYDDARSTPELRDDMNGTAVDTSDPNLRLAYKLQTNTLSSIPGHHAAEVPNLTYGDSILPLAPNARLSDASLIANIKVAVSGVLDGAAEKLFVDGNPLAANGAVTSGTLTACNIPWAWTYTVASSTFTFTAAGNGVPAGLAQALVQSLAYQNTSATASTGNRGFSISSTDVFGHTSSAATATLQDATLPGIRNLPATGLTLFANQPTDLADLVFTKADKTNDPAVLKLTVLATNVSISNLTDIDNLAAGIQLQGTAAELSSSFASARITSTGGVPGLTLTLGDAANHTVTKTYPLNGDDNTAPVLDLNGAAAGVNTTPANTIGIRSPIYLTGGPAGSATAPFVDLPDVQLGGDLTMEVQVNFSSLTDWSTVFDIGNGQSSSNLQFGVWDDGTVACYLFNGATMVASAINTINVSHPALVTGQWYHLALVVRDSTVKVYVNGVEWASTTLQAGTSISDITRSKTLVGKSNWSLERFADMQVKDVRVFDDARTASELASDKNGDPVDLTDPNLRLAYPLLGDGKSSIPNHAAAVLSNLHLGTPTVLLAPAATLAENSLVSTVKVSIDGILDAAAEKLWVGSTALAADGSGSSGSITVGTTSWTWAWAAANGATPSGFTFTAPGAGASALQAQELLQALGYSDSASPSGIGKRVISITATDVFNHASTAVTATLQDPTMPGINNLPSVALPVFRTSNTPAALDDLVFNKAGNTSTNASFKVTITATNGSVGGVTDEDPATAGIQISGTPAQLGSKFQNATFQANLTGTPGLSLVLSDSAGHTVTLAYPLVVNNGVAPVLDLNGAATGNNNTVAANTGSTQPVHLAGPASGAYLTLPTVQLGNDLTLEAWVNFSALSNWARVFDIGSSQTDNLILAIQSDGRVSSSIRVGATAVTVDSVVDATHPALLAGQWYHMALVVSGSTQKVYVNGIEWLSGNLPAGFSGSTVTRRTTTLIGKSAWGDPLATMQIRDVRVFDDARTLGELSADAAAITALDTQDPNLRLAYALNGNLQSSLPLGTAATSVSLAQADIPQDAPRLLAPVATLTADNNVGSVRVVLGGLQDGAAEKLSVGSSAIAADASMPTGTVEVGTTTWNWTYAADLATSSGTFTFTAPTGGVSSAVAQDLLQRLAYSNTSSTPHSGNRVFSITATDIFGTPSATATATVDDSLPGISNLPTQPQGVAAAIASDLVDLVFTKGGSTSASDVLKLTVLATGADFLIPNLADADLLAPGFQISGTAATLSAQFATATLTANATGTPTLNLTLSDAVGHTMRFNYPLVITANEAVKPVLDLNGSASGNNLLQGNASGNTKPFNLTGGASGSSSAPYIDLPDVPLGGNLTLEARVNFSNIFGWERVFDIGNGESNSNLILGVQADGRVSMALRNGGSSLFNDPTSTQVLVPGTWHHLALVVTGTTAKAFVDGVEWVSGTLSAPITDRTRANTWIGRSNWAVDKFSNMQVKDVRIYDDARTTGAGSELASDVSGTAVDINDPNLRLAYSLEGTTASSIPGGAPAEAVNLLASNTGTSLAPAAVLSDASPIKSFKVGVVGIVDGAAEKLLLGSTGIALDGSVTAGTLPVGADSWSWTYANSVFTFTAPTGGVPTYTVQGLLQSLKYSDSAAATPTGGTRTFSITATDIWNNTSLSATSSIDTGTPSITNLPAAAQALALTRGTAADLADLNFSRGGNSSTADTLKLSIFAVNGTLGGGLQDADANADGIQLTGTAAQLANLFAPATFTAAASGTPALLFNLTDAVGHSVNYQYPLSA